MGMTALKPGVCTTIQDLGRFGCQASGFSPSGAMDARAAKIANILVDNPITAPVLEFCLAGPTLRFTTSTIIALTGGAFQPLLNGLPVEMYKALPVKRGSILSMKGCVKGMFGYLAVTGGGPRITPVMGSFSTNLKCHIGGYKGRSLNTGDYLSFVTSACDFIPNIASHTLQAEDNYLRTWQQSADAALMPTTLRVIPGPQADMFTDEGVHTFYNETYYVNNQCDRMGYRLDGAAITTKHGSDIISDGIALGAIQVPHQGKPIIMLADRQTTGGYAKIGTVASVDIPKLVQSPPKTPIRFEAISVTEAQRLYLRSVHELEGIARMVKRPSYGGISPRKTARRLTPILEAQAQATEGHPLWIETETTAHHKENRQTTTPEAKEYV